ncbi:hypothetical protein C5E01_04730 [Rathayibacter iranicus]|nr:hypothetical protein C5E01_04730 [Rathayibacter iranicus]
MGERRRPHVLLETSVQRRSVARGQARQEPGSVSANQRRACEEVRAEHRRDAGGSLWCSMIEDGRGVQQGHLPHSALPRANPRREPQLRGDRDVPSWVGEHNADGRRHGDVADPERGRLEPHAAGGERARSAVDAHGHRSNCTALRGAAQRFRMIAGSRHHDGGNRERSSGRRDQHSAQRGSTAPPPGLHEQPRAEEDHQPRRGAGGSSPLQHRAHREQSRRPRARPTRDGDGKQADVRRTHGTHGAT